MSNYWQGKGAGKRIAIRFTKPLLGDVTGNETAFTVKGMVRNPLKYGPLTERTFTVESVERYPLERYWQDDFSGQMDGVEVGVNGVVLESAISGQVEDFETGNSLTLGDMPVERQAGSAKNGSYGLKRTSGAAASQKVIDDIAERGADFLLSGWVRTDSDHSVTGLTGLCFGVPAGLGISGYQVLLDVRNGSAGTTTAGIQLRKDYSTGSLLASASVTVNTNSWYFIEVTWSSAGLITAKLYNASLELISTISATDTTYASGKYGVAAYSNSSFDDITLGVVAFNALGTYTATTPADTLPTNPRLKWTEDLPTGTSITAEYAVNQDDETPPETWIAINNADLLTIPDPATGYFLWLRFTLATTDTAVTPTLLAVWLEEAEAPPGTILLTMAPDSRFNDVEGDITVSYEREKGTLTGTRPVEDFTESFTPTGLEPTPIDRHDITAGIEVAVDLIKVDYIDLGHKNTITAGITVEVDLIPVSEIPP